MIETDYLENPRIQRLLSAHTTLFSTELRWNLQSKTEGVFLWLKLAINSLIRGLNDLDTAEILASCLNELPIGMNDLYTLMLTRNNSDKSNYGKVAARYLHFALYKEGISLTDFCLATNDELRAELLAGDVHQWKPDRLWAELDIPRTSVWIELRTGGLLEVRNNSKNLVTQHPLHDGSNELFRRL